MKLASRLRALAAVSQPERAAQVVVPSVVLEGVKRALISGETHYTNRPGIPALRTRLAQEIVRLGGPSYDPDLGVVITASAREALFVTLLGLGLPQGEVLIAGAAGDEYAGLFSLVGLRPRSIGPLTDSVRLLYFESVDAPAAAATTVEATAVNLPILLNLRSAVGAAGAPAAFTGPACRPVIVGDLDALPGMPAFGVGFVAGPTAMVGAARTWKQAFSICTAAPSQRAALVALAARQTEGV
jgi:aspartate/methionine/tyrosine aminotransferase